MPIFWGVLEFLLFNAPQSTATDVFWLLVYLTCPPWLIPDSSVFGSGIVTPILNAALYATIVACASLGDPPATDGAPSTPVDSSARECIAEPEHMVHAHCSRTREVE